MAFKSSDMHDVGELFDKPVAVQGPKKKHYPTITLGETRLKALKKLEFKDDVTVHAHGVVTGQSKYNDEPAQYTIELQKVGIKEGHNPRAKWMSQSDFEAYERCLVDLKGKQGINPHAVCMNSIKQRVKKRRGALKRLK